jgi:formate hydrogenlyase subunit 3/multisubunit Na+/H+ antiporter MnhD subunit
MQNFMQLISFPLLLIPIIGALCSFVAGRIKVLRESSNIIFTGLLLIMVLKLHGFIAEIEAPFIFGVHLHIGINPLSWFFLFIISFISFLSAVFAAKNDYERKDTSWYYATFFFKIFGMVGLVLAKDLITFFIFWEIMSVFTYLIMIYKNTDEAYNASSRYLILSILGSLVYIVSALTLYKYAHSFTYDAIHDSLMHLSTTCIFWTSIGLATSFIMKSATMPLHFWLPEAYSSSTTSMMAFMISVSSRMGIYGFVVLFYLILGDNISIMNFGHFLNFRYLFAIIAGLTIVIPTFTALLQNDAKKLLAWHGIGQGGYMLIGLAIGTPMAMAGGLFHVVNHAIYILLLVFGVAAVEKRTGTTDLNSLGGLIKKMPVAFLSVLIGIIGLAGIPPMNGFVSKWMIYKSSIVAGYPFIALFAFLGTIGTILSVYKFIHNMFLGQLQPEHKNVKATPFIMQLPMYVLMASVWILGVFPGIVLKQIAAIQNYLDMDMVQYTMNGVSLASGHLNMLMVNHVMFIGFVVATIVFFLGGKRILVNQYNNYAAGHFLDETVPYNYNYNFYPALKRMLLPLDKDLIMRFVNSVSYSTKNSGELLRRIFSGQLNHYALYIILTFIFILGGLTW